MSDFRAARMPSTEGQGVARKAWDTYAKTVTTAALPLTTKYAVNKIEDLVGFWVLWHGYGGFERLVELGYSPSSVNRRIRAFRHAFGEHPDVFEFSGLTLDRAKWLEQDQPTD